MHFYERRRELRIVEGRIEERGWNSLSLFSVCKVEWETTVHDGPVTMMARSPFIPHLLLTVGGYREEGTDWFQFQTTVSI